MLTGHEQTLVAVYDESSFRSLLLEPSWPKRPRESVLPLQSQLAALPLSAPCCLSAVLGRHKGLEDTAAQDKVEALVPVKNASVDVVDVADASTPEQTEWRVELVRRTWHATLHLFGHLDWAGNVRYSGCRWSEQWHMFLIGWKEPDNAVKGIYGSVGRA